MHEEERRELVSRLFALLTAKLEDAAGLAAEAQGVSGEVGLVADHAQLIVGIAQEAEVLASAACGLLKPVTVDNAPSPRHLA